MVPENFHDVDGDLSYHIEGNILGLSKILMLPAHFHDVTNDKSRSGNSAWCRSQTRNTRAT